MFERTSSGRLQRMTRDYPERENRYSTYKFVNNRVNEEWHGSLADGTLFQFAGDGEKSNQQEWANGLLQVFKEFKYEEGGKRVSYETDYQNDTVTFCRYDENDRVIYRRTTSEGKLIEEVRRKFDGKNLVEKHRKSPGLQELWKYHYNSEDEVSREDYYKNEERKKTTYYTGENSYYEEYYRRDVPFLRVFYENDRKIDEEFIRSDEN
jgi:hypothetical protein